MKTLILLLFSVASLNHASVVDNGRRAEVTQDEKYLVTAGHRVTVYFAHNSFTVKAVAIAMDSGRKDDVVRVRNSSTSKLFQAKVVKRNVVEIVRH